MTDITLSQDIDSSSIAILVMDTGASHVLCPFFGKCDGVLLVDRLGIRKDFLQNADRSTESLCDLIVRSGAKSVICGFVSEQEQKKLQEKGIDVRLGSCACTTEELAANFDKLERA